MHWREIIRRPIITEKSNKMADWNNQYSFVVHPDANKLQIAQAIEAAFPDVKVDKVRVLNMPAKRGRRLRRRVTRKASYKKAVVTLASGRIDVFEGAA